MTPEPLLHILTQGVPLFLCPSFAKPSFAFALKHRASPEPSPAPGMPEIEMGSGKDGKDSEPDIGSALSELNPGFLMAIYFLRAFL